MSIATGRDSLANSLILNPPATVQIVIPSVCFMEAFSALEADLKYRRRLSDELRLRRSDARRNLSSQYAQSLSLHLREALAQNELLIQEVKEILLQTLNQLANTAQMISLTADMVQASLQANSTNEPTDNLILNCILNHARLHPTKVKVFLSGNANDFGRTEVLDALQDVGVNQYFSNSQAFINWWRSQLD